MNRLILTLSLALAVQSAFASPLNLQPIREIPNEFNLVFWDNYTVEELDQISNSLEVNRREKSNTNVCEAMRVTMLREGEFDACVTARNQTIATVRVKQFLTLAYQYENLKLAQYAVAESRKVMTETLFQKMFHEVEVSEIKEQENANNR